MNTNQSTIFIKNSSKRIAISIIVILGYSALTVVDYLFTEILANGNILNRINIYLIIDITLDLLIAIYWSIHIKIKTNSTIKILISIIFAIIANVVLLLISFLAIYFIIGLWMIFGIFIGYAINGKIELP
jgi:hypothetical protein